MTSMQGNQNRFVPERCAQQLFGVNMSTREKSDLQAPLWQPTPDQIVRTQLHAFMQRVNANYGRQLQTYGELY
ncbi:MAG: hypothetical protein KDK27_02400, partial [Leptospiraceae bacterium]|nr:hypothetical protein [Leptospiraceae bacterium]